MDPCHRIIATPLHIFVYGTLKRGEERAVLWPRPPRGVEVAVAPGLLYDLGPYPALLPGDGLVRGELWEIAPEDLDLTLHTLDAIEGFNQGEPDWYRRATLEARTLSGIVRLAHVYYFARPEEIGRYRRVPAGKDGVSEWHSRPSPK